MDAFQEDMTRRVLVNSIATEEARLAESFSQVAADCLAHQLVSLREIARTAEQRREAADAIDRYNANATAFGLEEI
jgi:hypothetical protein